MRLEIPFTPEDRAAIARLRRHTDGQAPTPQEFLLAAVRDALDAARREGHAGRDLLARRYVI